MPYYRVTYEGYTEGHFDDEVAATKEFLECIAEDLDGDLQNIGIEVFNEETEKWE